jgi:hypothetical protein
VFRDSSQGSHASRLGSSVWEGRAARSVRVRLPAPGRQNRRFAQRSSRRDGRAVGPVRRESTSTAELGPRENPDCCSGSPACSCSGSTPARCRRCCSSSRPESRGRGPLTAHHRTVYHRPAKSPARDATRTCERRQGRGPLLQGQPVNRPVQKTGFEGAQLPLEAHAGATIERHVRRVPPAAEEDDEPRRASTKSTQNVQNERSPSGANRQSTDNTRWLARNPFTAVSAAPGSCTGRVNTR